MRWVKRGAPTVLLWVVISAAPSAGGEAPAPPPLPMPAGGTVTFADLRGRQFKDAKVLRIEPGSLVVMTSDGIIRVPAALLPQEIRDKFGIKQEVLRQDPPGESARSTNAPEMKAEAPPKPEMEGAKGGGALGVGIKVEDRSWVGPAIGKIHDLAVAGQFQPACGEIIKLQGDPDLNASEPAVKGRYIEACVEVFHGARRQGLSVPARGALSAAMTTRPDAPQIMGGILVVFDEMKASVVDGLVSEGMRQFEVTEGLGLDSQIFYTNKRKELSDVAVDAGWRALKSLDIKGAGAAMKAAHRLWDRNPRLEWLQNVHLAVIYGGIGVGIIVGALILRRFIWWVIGA